LPSNIEKIVLAHLIEATIVQWTDHKNQNGNMAYVVLTRDTDPGDLAHPDSFDIIFKQESVSTGSASIYKIGPLPQSRDMRL
jgi:hypothetical protein